MGKICPYCKGNGKYKRYNSYGKILGTITDADCSICHGSGKFATCDGTGEIL